MTAGSKIVARALAHRYTAAVDWIALNDDAGSPGAFDQDEVAAMLTVCLTADVFGKKPFEVAGDVIMRRERFFPAAAESARANREYLDDQRSEGGAA